MRKWEKRYWNIVFIAIVIICIFAFVVVKNKNRVSSLGYEILKNLILFGVVLVIVAVLIYYAIHIILFMKNGIHNIKECDDVVFNEIDKHKKCWGESKESYIKQIQIINLFYKENGKVDELVKNKEIDILQMSMKENYLWKRLNIQRKI